MSLNKNIQDQVWSILPKEFKEGVKALRQEDKDKIITAGAALIELFGHHNLTSDEESPEMQVIPRSAVMFRYEDNKRLANDPYDSYAKLLGDVRMRLLTNLFGNKCLPDEESKGLDLDALNQKLDEALEKETKESLEEWLDNKSMTEERYQYLNSLDIEKYNEETSVKEQKAFCKYQHKYHPNDVTYWQTHSEDKAEPDDTTKKSRCEKCGAPNLSVCAHLNCQDYKPTEKAEPKFKVGSCVLRDGLRCRVLEYDASREFPYLVHVIQTNNKVYTTESDLEPYTEPTEEDDFNIPEPKCIHFCNGKCHHPAVYHFEDDEMVKGADCDVSSCEDVEYEPTEPKSDDMEEKELNLGEILKDHIGETFFHPMYGDVEVNGIKYGFIYLNLSNDCTASLPANDCLHPSGMARLYPDAESLKKYPFDGLVAWQEWIEANKPKYILQAQIRLISNHGKTIEDSEIIEIETSDEDMTQAAEAVKATLEQFHKDHQQ